MAPDPLTECAYCGTPATKKCAGCADAPEYKSDDSSPVYYCGSDCQKKHWPTHKPHCKNMQKRKKLMRASQILKAAIVAYRETSFNDNLTSIKYRDGALYFNLNLRTLNCAIPRHPFPTNLTDNIEHKEAALLKDQCFPALSLLCRLTKKLLQGVASNMNIIHFRIGKVRVPTIWVPKTFEDPPHMVLKIELTGDNETWIIDTTGCQYGFRDVLVPFLKYYNVNECRIVNGNPGYDFCETTDVNAMSSAPETSKFSGQIQDLGWERACRLQFAAFYDKANWDDILVGSDAVFKEKIHRLVNELKSHMLNR